MVRWKQWYKRVPPALLPHESLKSLSQHHAEILIKMLCGRKKCKRNPQLLNKKSIFSALVQKTALAKRGTVFQSKYLAYVYHNFPHKEVSSRGTHPLIRNNLICSLLKRVEANTLEELAIGSFCNWWCQSIILCFDFNSLRLAAGICICCAKVIHVQILLVCQILLLQSFI